VTTAVRVGVSQFPGGCWTEEALEGGLDRAGPPPCGVGIGNVRTPDYCRGKGGLARTRDETQRRGTGPQMDGPRLRVRDRQRSRTRGGNSWTNRPARGTGRRADDNCLETCVGPGGFQKKGGGRRAAAHEQRRTEKASASHYPAAEEGRPDQLAELKNLANVISDANQQFIFEDFPPLLPSGPRPSRLRFEDRAKRHHAFWDGLDFRDRRATRMETIEIGLSRSEPRLAWGRGAGGRPIVARNGAQVGWGG